ncbi:MAG: site-2 protease family protein, partial [Chloroflexi bacterium]|nr:site-2 protease family protein [Chloroflexota bacterium]
MSLDRIPSPAEAPVWQGEQIAGLQVLLRGVFALQDVTALAQPPGAIRLRGQFLVPTSEAYAALASRARSQGYTPIFREEQGQPTIVLLPGLLTPGKERLWPNLVLLLATLLSMLWVGATMEVDTVEAILQRPWVGWPFALGLLAILAAHEGSHYLVSRRFGVSVSLPYFIPMPAGPFGTMGAFINMRTPPPSRRAALFIGAAGPLGGLVVAIPLLILGLHLSTVLALPQGQPYMIEGNSLLYAL